MVALVPSTIEQYHWNDVVDAFRLYKLDQANLASEEEVLNEFPTVEGLLPPNVSAVAASSVRRHSTAL
jgi:hypothetical protein